MSGLLLMSAAALFVGQTPGAHDPAQPEARALAYLSREVPRWSADNKCFSCHNNGDATRALYTATRLGYALPAKALDDTSRWLATPDKWDHNGGEGPFSDKGLARIQFAAALVDGLDAGLVKDKQTLTRAAELVAEGQHKDGCWQANDDTVGAPATYGTALATHMARRTLQRADAKGYRAALERSEAWLSQASVKRVLDAAAVLLALEGSDNSEAVAQRKRCWEPIRKGESKDGGWGPYVNSPSEPFDTAIVLLSLARYPDEPGARDMIRRGRAFLIAAQERDGNWKETTRPAGAESYAQRLSTTGWATLALLATNPKR
jgi:squalene cyclase